MEKMTGGVAGKDDLCRLIYVSRNLLEGPAEAVEQEVFRILEVSRRNNLRDGITGALLVLALIVVVQQIEGNVLSPILQSKSMNLHAAVVLLSVTLGSTLFGITGAFLAVPVVAVAAVVLRYLDEQLPRSAQSP